MFLGYQSIELLGHLVEVGKVKPVPGKLEAIQKLTPPKNVKQIKSYLGLVGFYRRFIKKFANLAAPLVKLLSKSAEFKWGKVEQKSFDDLKQALLDSAGLFLPSPTGRFRIYTDYSADVVSAILH